MPAVGDALQRLRGERDIVQQKRNTIERYVNAHDKQETDKWQDAVYTDAITNVFSRAVQGRNNENDLIYTSSQTLLNVSNYVNLASYMQEFSMNNNKLELSYILNKAYLLEIEKNNQAFKNIEIDNKEITITPLYILSIPDTNTRSYLNYFTITKEEDGTILWPVGITLDIDYDGEDISLYTILSHYNLLTEEKQEYSFTEEEIKNLITNYIDELKETKAR